MRLERDNGNLIVWQTGCHNNEIEYDSTVDDLTLYSRRKLSVIEKFLREHDETQEADKIKAFLGKIIRCETIPQLTPTGNYEVYTGLEYLEGTINDYIECDDLDLDPDFQRGHVWNMEQRVAFVEFILQGGKTNPIYFNQPNSSIYENHRMVIVDGKQRLTSLLMFLRNEFPVFKLYDPEGIGYYRKDFDYVPKGIKIVVNNLPTRRQVLQWYLEINRGNIAHTEQELKRVEDLLMTEIVESAERYKKSILNMTKSMRDCVKESNNE